MERAAEIEGEEIGDIDQRVDRPKPDRDEPPPQPVGAFAIAQAAETAPQNVGAGLRPFDPPAHRRGEAGGNRGGGEGLEGAEPGCGELAGEPAHGERIAAVGGDVDLDHRIVEPGPGGVSSADRRVFRQIDDPRMILADPDLAGRKQHPGAFHAADAPHLEGHAKPRNEAPGRGEHRLHPAPRIGRAADHLHLFAPRIDAADLEPVRRRMGRGLDDAGDAEGGEGRAVIERLDLEADRGEGGGDFGKRGAGFEVIAQPGEGEAHQSPSCKAAGRKGLAP